MKAKQFEQKHGLGYNNAPYLKKYGNIYFQNQIHMTTQTHLCI